MGNKQKKN